MTGSPVCPECGKEIVAVVCGADPNMSPESAAALREVIVAAHRRMAHPDVITPSPDGPEAAES